MNMNKLATALVGVLALAGGAAAQTDPRPAQQPGPAAPSRSENAELLSEIMRQLYGCWHPPRDARASVTLRFSLNRDGTLAGGPTLVKFSVGTRAKDVIDTAMRAVRACPLHLPPAKYQFWREIEANFDAGPD